jgi:diadenosine tetraphosphate (Ap4A) HIT family hydrolase
MSFPCYICDIFENGVGKPYKHLFPRSRLSSEVLRESRFFAAILDIAPIVEGYMLIVTKEHRTAFSQMGQAELDDLEVFISSISDVLFRAYGVRPQLYEHGCPNSSPRHSCCVEHAHLHLVPFAGQLLVPDEWQRFRRIKGLAGLCSIHKEYLYLRDAKGQSWLCDKGALPHQYFRKNLAHATGAEVWNWTDYVMLAAPLQTRLRLKAARKRLLPLL